MNSPRHFWFALLGLAALARSVAAENPDRAALIEGVPEISAPGLPGSLSVFGDQAFPVVVGGLKSSAREPVVAAARAGLGRVVAFGHTSYLNPKSLSADTQKFFLNSIRWAANAKLPGRVVVCRERGLADFLKTQNIDAEDGDVAKLTGARVVIISAHAINEQDVLPLWKFVSGGGGLITASTGWGWAQLNPGKELKTDLMANRLLIPCGLVITGGTVEKSKDGFATTLPPELSHAGRALAAVGGQLAGKTKLPAADATQAASTLTLVAQSLPPEDKTFLPKLRALAAQAATAAVPSSKKPIKKDDVAGRLALTLQIEMTKSLPVGQTVAHPAAANFPGSIPADAHPATRTVAIDTHVPGWHSLGLYAAPGAILKVSLPANAGGKGLGARIGCHSDGLWNVDTWRRAPEITRQFSLKQTETSVANAFGGLVYVMVPEKCDLGTISVTVAGAIDAPLFVLGKTKPDEWRAKLRALPGPWAELATDKIILSVPSHEIRALDDPEALLKFWDQVLDAEADLAAIPRARKRPERIVADEQISAGYMHSGYPIMTHLDAAAHAVSLEKMKAGDWGHFHELGHNHQQGDWTFAGTGEVTCNLFSLYVSETVCGLPAGQGHDAMKPETAANRMEKYLADGADFEKWKSDPFLALTMYNQLRVAFGWEMFKKLFAEYRALPSSEKPQGDDEKRDQWMTRFSRKSGKNLGPFFQAWGVPTSEKARSAIADLPAWMPEDFPKSKTSAL